MLVVLVVVGPVVFAFGEAVIIVCRLSSDSSGATRVVALQDQWTSRSEDQWTRGPVAAG